MANSKVVFVEKTETGISGFDEVSAGGLPRNRTTLVSGTAGSAKTILAVQFLAEGIKKAEEDGVFVTFEEPPDDIRANMLSFGWDIEKWEQDGKWAFVDASCDPERETIEVGAFDLGALLARIEHAIKKTKAKRVSMDSLGAVFGHFENANIVRRELHRMAAALKKLGVTVIMTVERVQEFGGISRLGVEEFVADNVIVLRNALEDQRRRRTIEILKFRGTTHSKGEYPFSIISGQGIIVIPLSAMELKQDASNIRITSGNTLLDQMCGGGFFRDSIILVSGATGNGKTLMVTEFVAGGVSKGERCLLFTFEESHDQIFRNATGWGFDFEKMEREGMLKVICEYPEIMSIEEHLIRLRAAIREFKPSRIALDGLSALERISTGRGFREFVIGLRSFIKHQEIAGLFTSTTSNMFGGASITDAHISTITDSIILLKYVEMFGEMRRGITVIKMRGSAHNKEIREFTIDAKGMHIGLPFQNVAGILSGHPTHISQAETERLRSVFSNEVAAT